MNVKPHPSALSVEPAHDERSRTAAAEMEARLPPIMRHLFPTIAGLPLGPVLTHALRSLARRRPQLFERLGEHSSLHYFVDPVDLAFAFMVVPDAECSLVRAVGKSEAATSNVVIRGPLMALLGLLDGSLDGDALFFNRIISISGRTEAILALRNAIEAAELTPADLLGLSGPLARIANDGILGSLKLARRIAVGRQARTGQMR